MQAQHSHLPGILRIGSLSLNFELAGVPLTVYVKAFEGKVTWVVVTNTWHWRELIKITTADNVYTTKDKGVVSHCAQHNMYIKQ